MLVGSEGCRTRTGPGPLACPLEQAVASAAGPIGAFDHDLVGPAAFRCALHVPSVVSSASLPGAEERLTVCPGPGVGDIALAVVVIVVGLVGVKDAVIVCVKQRGCGVPGGWGGDGRRSGEQVPGCLGPEPIMSLP